MLARIIGDAISPSLGQPLLELLGRLKAKGGTYGIPGIGSTTHLAGEVVLRQAGVKATPIPYPGSSQMFTDVVSGQIDFAFNTVGAALPLIKTGRLRALAVTSADRVASLPDVRSASESGIAGLKVVGWWGIVAPTGTPSEIVKKLSDALVKALDWSGGPNETGCSGGGDLSADGVRLHERHSRRTPRLGRARPREQAEGGLTKDRTEKRPRL